MRQARQFATHTKMPDDHRPPTDARRGAPTTTFAPAARRELTLFGATAELVLLPGRAARPNRPGEMRAAFGPDRGLSIVEAEATWRERGLALTGNKFPFARAQTVLWSERPLREPDEDFLDRAFRWVDERGGALLVNSIGAAASIARAHAHHTDETLPFLAQLRERSFAAEWLPRVDGASYWTKDVPFCLLGVRGPATARKRAVAALQTRRLTAAVNLVSMPGETWVYPRAIEAPAPFFPYALGAAEAWGRWCFVDEAPFLAAKADDLEQALRLAGCNALPHA